MRSLTFFFITLVFVSVTEAQVNLNCSNPERVRGMIQELKDSFECSGLSASDCQKLIGGSIGGALAARIAVGLRTLKRTPELKDCLGDISKTASHFESPLWMLWGSSYAFAWGDPKPIIGCTIDRKNFTRNLEGLAKEYREEVTDIRRAMALRLAEDALKRDDLSKVFVTGEEIQKATLKNLKEFQAAIENPTLGPQIMGDPVKLSIMRDSVKIQIELLENARNDLISAAQMANERIFFSIPEETRDAWERKFTVSRIIKEQTQLKLDELAGPRAKKAFEKALEALNNTGWEKNKVAYLRNLGYSELAIKEVLAHERTVQNLTSTRQLIDHTVMELHNAPEYKSVSQLDATKIKQITQKYLPHIGHRLPIVHMAELPGAALRLQSKIIAMGRAQLASMASQTSGLKSAVGVATRAGVQATRAAAGTVLGAGGTIATFSTNAFAAECKSMGDRKSPYVELEPGQMGCAPSSERTPASDFFLFGLSPAEQQDAVADPQNCTMLNKLFERYAPSAQWQVQCPIQEGGEIVLAPKIEDPSQPTVRFVPQRDGSPKSLAWFVPAQSLCMNLSQYDTKSPQVFTTRNSQQTVCEAMDAGSMDRYQPPSRPNDPKFTRVFAHSANQWTRFNSYTFASANDCCRGHASPLCPSGRTTPPNSSSAATATK